MHEQLESNSHSSLAPNISSAGILVVDFESTGAPLLQESLGDLAVRVVEANTKEEALRRVQAAEYAVILLFPYSTDGCELVRMIRTHALSQRTPVMVIADQSLEPSVIEEGYRLGVVDFLVKPNLPAALRAKVRIYVQLFEDRQRARGEVEQLRNAAERPQSADHLQRSDQRFARFMQHLPGLAWIKDVQGRYVYVNDAAEQAFQMPRVKLYGKTDEEVFPPETAAQFRENDQQALSSGTGIQVVEALQHADGVVRYSLVSKFPITESDGQDVLVGGMAIDITEHRRMQDALKKSERIYRAVGESIDYGVWICDREGRNIYTSDSFLRLVGLTQKDCSEFGWGSVLHPDDAERTIAAWKECVRIGGQWDIEHRFRGVDGRWHFVLARGVPVKNDHGEIMAWGVRVKVGEG